jgi:hypothetical protein
VFAVTQVIDFSVGSAMSIWHKRINATLQLTVNKQQALLTTRQQLLHSSTRQAATSATTSAGGKSPSQRVLFWNRNDPCIQERALLLT